jgi:hypothetical protein
MSGWMPMERSSATECWVGLVFNSPAVWMIGQQRQMDEDALASRQSWPSWRIASRKGSPSMSPTVPPISTARSR